MFIYENISDSSHAGAVSDSNSDTISENNCSNSCVVEEMLYDTDNECLAGVDCDVEFGDDCTVASYNCDWHLPQLDSDSDSEPDMDEGLAGKLAAWVANNNISQVALGELLQILCKYHKLQKDPRTVLKTKRTTDIMLDTIVLLENNILEVQVSIA